MIQLELICLILLVFLLVIFSLWASAFFFGAPFESSSGKAIKIMAELSEIKASDKNNGKKIKIADLGSGTGKVLISFAKLNPNIEAHGFEIDPFLSWLSRAKIKRLGLEKRIFIHTKNYWKQDFSDFDLITAFQINYAMAGLEKKFRKELKKGAKVVSNTWKFPHWKPEKKIKNGLTNVFLYVKK